MAWITTMPTRGTLVASIWDRRRSPAPVLRSRTSAIGTITRNQLFVYVAATASGGTLVTGNYNGSTAGFYPDHKLRSGQLHRHHHFPTISPAPARPVCIISTVGSLTTKTANGGHSFVASPSGFSTTAVPTLSINFANTAGVLNDLTTYIGSASGGDFALLLDSDLPLLLQQRRF